MQIDIFISSDHSSKSLMAEVLTYNGKGRSLGFVAGRLKTSATF